MTLNDIGDFLFRTFALSIRTVGDATDGESVVALMPADTRTLAQKVTMEELLKSVLALVLRSGWRRLNLSFSPEGVS